MIVRRHPGRSALLAGALGVALLLGVLVLREGGGSTGAGRLGPGAASATSTVDGTARGAEPSLAEPPASPVTGEAAGEGQPGATTGPTAPGAGGGGRLDPGPVAPREPVRCPSQGMPTAAPLPPADRRDGRQWVTVGRLNGSCDASSAPFQLLGIDTRLVWRSDADSFAVFIVDVVAGRDATAGFADGRCAGSCSERQPVVPPAGRYRLEVQAGDGPWEVEVQEYRRP